ncbi:hypothetical protein EDD93_3711 [Streptomyces sp. 840.1]|uniref:hypothetical protein n=1 Tax=Streptomyces sp. 840.1 TaxID=2485152 RepID=UPI000F4A7BC8|nr:hypothetical protein [Streptomyces sp. 840.1]ROQ69214.1 hypothetical protein EDD93_3711 [Streptomyces sp. 840.1]
MTVLRFACGSVALYAASLVPFLALVDADMPEHVLPAWVRTLPLTTAALLMLTLGGTNAR